MIQNAPTYRGTSAAVMLLLKIARESGIIVNRMKLAKLLYLADLHAVDAGLPPGTEVEWKWRYYGPHSTVLQQVELDLYVAKVIDAQPTETFYGNREVRLRLLEAIPQLDIDAEFAAIVARTVADYGHLSASQLKELTYQTPPMQSATRRGQREVRLDLTGGDPYPDIAPALRRLQAVLREMPPAVDEDGGIEDLTAELAEWEPVRRAVTTQMVDAE